MKILIAGGGIGGLAAGIALKQVGVKVEILEAAEKLTEVGAGLQIGANGTRVLRELGLESAIAAAAVQPDAWEFRDLYTAQMVYRAPLIREDGSHVWNYPLYNIHRADLINILGSFLENDELKLGAQVKHFSQHSSGVTVITSNGNRYEADALIGADGINSVVRQGLWGTTEKKFAGKLMWRSLLSAKEVEGIWLPERGNYWTGPGRTLVTYWLRKNELYSILATVPSEEVGRENWDLSGDVNDLRKSFLDIEPRAADMMSRIKEAFITGMFFRDPVEQWSNGRITLLGDAAHPMTPYYAQGATQSLEDVWVLAQMVSSYGSTDIAKAFIEYEKFRRPRATRLQAGSRRMVKITHETDLQKINARNGMWKGQRRIDPDLTSDFKFVWGYDVVKAIKEGETAIKGISGTFIGLKKKRKESQRALDLWLSVTTPENVAQGYEGLRVGYDAMLMKHCGPDEDLKITKDQAMGVPFLSLEWPENKYDRNDQVVLHCHGGGYMIGSAESSVGYASKILQALKGTKAITVDYRKGPEEPYPAALDDVVTVYRELLRAGIRAEQIIFSGESSGAGLVLAVAMALRMAGDPLPKGIIAVAPFADLTLSGESVRQYDGLDAAANPDTLKLMAEGYFQGHEPRDPLVSPVFGNYHEFPPILITAARDEVLYSDAVRVVENARRDGVNVTAVWVNDSVHVYPIFPFLPETKQFMEKIFEWNVKL